MDSDVERRIKLLKSALAGAERDVYEWAANYVHTESIILQFELPCCLVKNDKANVAKQTSKPKPKNAEASAKPVAPEWKPFDTGEYFTGLKNKYIKFDKNGTVKSGLVMDAFTDSHGSLWYVVLVDSGFMTDVKLGEIKEIDVSASY